MLKVAGYIFGTIFVILLSLLGVIHLFMAPLFFGIIFCLCYQAMAWMVLDTMLDFRAWYYIKKPFKAAKEYYRVQRNRTVEQRIMKRLRLYYDI